MKLADLEKKGGIVADELVKRKAKWNGDDIDFYVKMLSFGDIDRTYNGSDMDASQAATLISKAVRLGDDGSEQLSYEQAYSLTPALATIFAEHVMTVNGVGDDAADPLVSGQKKNSGTK